MKPNIFLIGFMGTGKTTVGKQLAHLTGMEFCDLDQIIEQTTRLSISDIFEKKGEFWFRELESKLLIEVAGKKNKIVSTGGGIVLRPINRSIIKSKGIVVSLTASMETLWKRLKNSNERPLLKGDNPKEILERLYLQRTPLYDEAHYIIQVDGKKPIQIAKEILELLD